MAPSTRPQRPYNVKYYAKNRESELARVKKRQAATLTWLRDLRRRPCDEPGDVSSAHDGLRSSRSEQKGVPAERWLRTPHVTGPADRRNRRVRCRLCELPRTKDIRRPSGTPPSVDARGVDSGYVALYRAEARSLARQRRDAERVARCPVCRLWPEVPALRNAVRPSRPYYEEVCDQSETYGRTRHASGRGREVRYRLYQLSPRSHIQTADGGMTRE